MGFPLLRFFGSSKITARSPGSKKPWEIGKSFDRSAPLGPLQPVPKVAHFTQGAIWLKVNGQVKQKGDLTEMIWNASQRTLPALVHARAIRDSTTPNPDFLKPNLTDFSYPYQVPFYARLAIRFEF